MMVIAKGIVEMYHEFLDDPAGILSDDARNPGFGFDEPADPPDPAFHFLPDAALPEPGKGCIIGVIDDAIPFAHQRFTLPGPVSRVAAVWMQDAAFRGQVGADLPSGAEWRGAELSALLARAAAGDLAGEEAIYRLTGAVDMARPVPPSFAFAAGHGAAVAPLAAGFPPADGTGRNFPIIAVSLPPRIIADSTGVLAPAPILAGMVFIINRARRLCRFIERRTGQARVHLPVVINLSLGLTAGPRDGSTPLERFMDAVSESVPDDLGRIHFVLPAGNHRQARLRARLAPGQSLAWRLPPDDPTINAIEIWGPPRPGPPRGEMRIGLTPPGLPTAHPVFTGLRQLSVLTGPGGRDLARAYYDAHPLPDGLWREGITVIAPPTCPARLGEPFAPPGEWQVTIDAASPSGDYDLSAQRDEVIHGYRRAARQSWFHDLAYRSHDAAGRPILTDAGNGAPSRVMRCDTVNTYATGRWPLRGGAVHQQDGRTTAYTGLLADGQPGDCQVAVDRSVAHPGMLVCGRDSGGFALAAGTSMAAPQLARWLAQHLSDGRAFASRQAIRQQAQGQASRSDGAPIVGIPPRFAEF